MRRILSVIAFALVPIAAFGQDPTLNDHQKDVLNRVSAYFTGIHTMQGNFVQTDAANHRMKGKFYISRPGRFRFDYARPSKQVVVSDGRYLAVQDFDLNNEDRVALDQSVFRVILKSDVDLMRDAKVISEGETGDLVTITLEDKDANVPGQLRLIISTRPDLELKAWVVKDAQGIETRVDVSDLAKGVELDAEMFKIKPYAWVE